MKLFNFISDEAFRASLEADYHELELCMQVGRCHTESSKNRATPEFFFIFGDVPQPMRFVV